MRPADVQIGTAIPRLETAFGPEEVRRYALAVRTMGSRFLSDEGARREGLPRQIVPGNMSLSLLCRMLLSWLPEARLERIGVTFRGLVFPNRPIVCSGFVTDRSEVDGGVRLECDLVLESDGERKVTGVAILTVPAIPRDPGVSD